MPRQPRTPVKSAIRVEKSANKTPTKNVVQNCTLVGVQYDAKAVSAVQTIAEGLVENAKALGSLAEVLKASNVEIDTLLRLAD